MESNGLIEKIVEMIHLLEIPKLVDMGKCVGWFGLVGLGVMI